MPKARGFKSICEQLWQMFSKNRSGFESGKNSTKQAGNLHKFERICPNSGEFAQIVEKSSKLLKNFPNPSENFIKSEKRVNPAQNSVKRDKLRRIGEDIYNSKNFLLFCGKTAEKRINRDFTCKIGGFRVNQHFSATN